MQALWMLAAAWWFSLMAVGIKLASASFSALELVFFRGVVSMVLMGGLMRWQGQDWRTQWPRMHFNRSLMGVVSLATWFLALATLPLPTAMTLNYMSSLWLAAHVLMTTRGPKPWGLAAAVGLGFVGVVLALGPSTEGTGSWAALAGLASGITSAVAYTQIGALGRAGEPESRTVFYFSLASAVLGGLGATLQGWTPWSGVPASHLWWLLAIGLLASLGQWCLTRAYQKGSTLLAACMLYSGILFASLWALVWFNERLPWWGWMGICIIVSSGVWATFLRSRQVRKAQLVHKEA